MTLEDKELLLRDLASRLPYEVKGRVYAETTNGQYDISGDLIFFDSPFDVILDGINVSTEEIHVVAIGNEDTVDFIEEQQIDGKPYTIDEFKPYLRPMSSMTEEEKIEYRNLHHTEKWDHVNNVLEFDVVYSRDIPLYIDWLNAHHFDYHNLIERGLAIDCTGLNIY